MNPRIDFGFESSIYQDYKLFVFHAAWQIDIHFGGLALSNGLQTVIAMVK